MADDKAVQAARLNTNHISEAVADLTPEQRALLMSRLRKKASSRESQATKTVSIRPASRQGNLPLSFAQQRLWIADQLEPGNAAYNVPAAVSLKGRLSVGTLEQSISEIVKRHEVLRTTFPLVDGRPIQLISPARLLDLSFVDVSGLRESRQEAEARRLITEEAWRPFDLIKGPLLRATLVRLNQSYHIVLFKMHHIVYDGWSIGVLIREVATLYEAYLGGQPSPLPELPIQYADFTVWQRQWLQGEVLDAQLAYWKQRLTGSPPLLELPTDRARPEVRTSQGAWKYLTLRGPLAKSLTSLSQRVGITLFMTLLAGFKAWLHRYTGQDDIVVGTPIANRTRREIEYLIGFFVNTMVLRTDLSGNPTFRELLGRVRDVTLGAYAHQDLPFEMVVDELQPERNLSHTPLFQVMFALGNAPQETLELPDLRLDSLRLDAGATKFDLTIDFQEAMGNLILGLSYSMDLFDDVTITRMVGHFLTMLEACAANPQQRLSDLPLLPESERHQVLVEWNDTRRDYPLDECIHRLIEAQVERTPAAPAVIFEGERMTYLRLNEKANALAHALAERGVGPGAYVPVLMGRSIELIISLLAVMKSGAAFVPLDIYWPTERLKQALDDLSSDIVVVNHLTPHEEQQLGRSFLVVDRNASDERAPNPSICVDPDDPIYAIYTSGSTGRPKAAIVPHRGITNRFLWMNEAFGSESAAAALQTTFHVYDSAVWQLFWPLINGGVTVIPSSDLAMTADEVTALIEKHGVTITDFVPSVFNQIVPQIVADSKVAERLNSLRTVVIGGEEITPAMTHRFMESFPQVRVFNLYGPTEASIGCIYHEVTSRDGERIPIGRPIANVRVAILDQYRNPVPIGTPGKLYLSGVCLGLGYLNDEAKTKAAFISNPFSELATDRLYETGDLARYLTTREIEFLGRADHQIKIRGHRVELGEIEAALLGHPEVRAAVVLLRGDTAAQRRLVAYLVVSKQPPLSASELRSYLSGKLPEYMLPSSFVLLDAMPLMPSGKVDRKALPEPENFRPDIEVAYVAPRTRIEQVIAAVWQSILRIERVGIEDNFFELGGNSLLLIQAHSQLREALAKDLSIVDLFKYPTIGALSRYMSQQEEPASLERGDEMASQLEAGRSRLQQQLERSRRLRRGNNE